MRNICWLVTFSIFFLPGHLLADPIADLAEQLRKLDAKVLSDTPADQELKQRWVKTIQERRLAVNQRETEAWRKIQTRADWEKYRDQRIEALRQSLGTFPPIPKELKTMVTRTIQGEGFIIENLVYESRPGLVVTANLYRPEKPGKSMPGILIIHSHHNPKTQGELQDMGMTWARLGCLVLIPDQLGHGERRQHPFVDKNSYKGDFKVGRQDYYFRYNVGMQLHLIGDSLMGWMVNDMMRGVDLLLSQPGIDPKRIILLGSVAGGGDPAAVTAVLDKRIAAVVPFNFGGPQPETTFPLPDDAEAAFNYMGGGSWESTRNLRLSGRDGFLPWVIVGSVAPRGLIYAHEFAWDKDRDPVWKRLANIYDFYGAGDCLAFAHGRGRLSGKPPESTHCNNIGAAHRKPIYPALKRWFDIPIPEKEYQKRLPAEDLVCLTEEARKFFQPQPVHVLAAKLGQERSAAARKKLEDFSLEERRKKVHNSCIHLLGLSDTFLENSPDSTDKLKEDIVKPTKKIQQIQVHQIVVLFEEAAIPVTFLVPPHKEKEKLPAVFGIAQEGKAGFLKHRALTIARLLEAGVIVCLPDLRGTGETRLPGDARRRTSGITSLSSNELMHGRSLPGKCFVDLFGICVAIALSNHLPSLDSGRIACWGESFVPVNSLGSDLAAPLDAAKLPAQAEPLGGLLVLAIVSARDNGGRGAFCIRGGLVSYQSCLQSPFCYFPHDIVIPGVLQTGDLCDLAAVQAPNHLRLEGLVDGLNRRVSAKVLEEVYAPARRAYREAKAADRLTLIAEPESEERLAEGFLRVLKSP